MAEAPANSARRAELLERSYRYILAHGLTGMSLRPLAAAVKSSPRVLLFLFGSKEELVRAVLARAREDEIELLDRLQSTEQIDLARAGSEIWQWLSAEEHRGLLRLWLESYAQALVEPQGPWAGFATATVEDWLALLAQAQQPQERHSPAGKTQRTLLLAVLRGAMLDLLATGDLNRTTSAVQQALDQLPGSTSQPIEESRRCPRT